ncbi:MAG: cell division protein ZapA [Clostridia bacterium]|nr:cell division protein ZapA [Clostridia bacterium]
MKKKYTLVISDVEMSVVTDAPWESVEKIVGILDRKMRDINLKSYRCTKNQAALLCALEYCSEKLELQDRNAELEELAEQDAATIEQKDAKIAELEAQIAQLQNENEIMHNILERAAASTKRMMGHHEPEGAAKAEQPAAEAAEAAEVEQPEAEMPAEVPAEAAAEEKAEETIAQQQEQPAEAPEQLTVDFAGAEPESEVNVTAAKVIEEIAQSQSDVPRVKAKVKKSNNRSRVGSMFDLLTFNDV